MPFARRLVSSSGHRAEEAASRAAPAGPGEKRSGLGPPRGRVSLPLPPLRRAARPGAAGIFHFPTGVSQVGLPGSSRLRPPACGQQPTRPRMPPFGRNRALVQAAGTLQHPALRKQQLRFNLLCRSHLLLLGRIHSTPFLC